MISLKLTRTSFALKYYRAVCLQYANSEAKHMAETFTTVKKVRKVKDHLKRRARGGYTAKKIHSALKPICVSSLHLGI